MNTDKINRLAREVDKIYKGARLIVHVHDEKGREIKRLDWGAFGSGPRDVNIDLDEQDMLL
jgi:hypothetical protein